MDLLRPQPYLPSPFAAMKHQRPNPNHGTLIAFYLLRNIMENVVDDDGVKAAEFLLKERRKG